MFFQEADEIVQDKILNQLREITHKDIREKVILFSLPVIFWYSPEQAKKIAKEISGSKINQAWFRVIIWSLSKGQLGGVREYRLFKATTNSATIRDNSICCS